MFFFGNHNADFPENCSQDSSLFFPPPCRMRRRKYFFGSFFQSFLKREPIGRVFSGQLSAWLAWRKSRKDKKKLEGDREDRRRRAWEIL